MSSIAYPHVTYKEGFCGWCGEETLLYRNGKPKKWCSDYCGTSASSFRKTGRIAPLPEDRKAPVTHCLYCGEELQVTVKSRATKKYCNDSCSLKYRRSNNPRYRKLARERAQKNAARAEAAKPRSRGVLTAVMNSRSVGLTGSFAVSRSARGRRTLIWSRLPRAVRSRSAFARGWRTGCVGRIIRGRTGRLTQKLGR